jgi:MSHA biogenesis protein MshG
MARFAYTGRDPAGLRIEGLLESADAREAAARLIERGTTPLSIRPATAREAANDAEVARSPGRPGGFASLARRRSVDAVELQMFTRELHAMLKAGIPIMRALDILRDSTANPALAAMIAGVRGHLDSGLDIAESFTRENEHHGLFSGYYLAVLRVGEHTGRLEECLLRLSKYLEFQRVTREQIAAALRYPGFVLLAGLGALVVVNLFVLPQFEKVFRNMNVALPLLTRLLLAGSRFTVAWWPAMLAVAAGAVIAARLWVARPAGELAWHTAQLRLPIVGELISRSCLSRLTHALSLAMRSGVPLVQGLEIVARTVGNLRYERAVLEIRDRVSRGESIRSAALATGVFPPAMLQIVAVGEETGALDELLDELAGFYRSEVEYAISRLSSRLEPILIVGLGLVVLTLALGVFLPMWELGGATLGKAR